jgi:hypothetical protein
MIDRPRQPSEIQQLAGLARSTLYARLNDLLDIEIIDVARISEFPLRVAYSLTDTGRLALARELLTERSHRRRLAHRNVSDLGGLDELLGLLVPTARLSRGSKGRCEFVERISDGRRLTVCVVADEGKLRLATTRGRCLAHARGTSGEWDAALTDGGRHRLQLVGDVDFARRTVASLRAALRA